jgi:hypothetical protein
MAESGIEQLRIYCICGQKMKIAADMYGRPGKCVACRQKIRLPRPDEIPEGTTEIRIENHPEFLRKSKRKLDPLAEEREARRALAQAAPTEDDSGDSPTPITELDLHDETTPPNAEAPKPKAKPPKPRKKRKRVRGSVPLDVHPQLRTLCSLQFKLEHALEASVKALDKDNFAIAEIEGNLARLYRVRGDLDEQLRQNLMEVAIELSSTHEKIAETNLSARVGEISYEAYHEKIYRLRARRDRLERRQLNFRGWLSAQDPYVAGGYIDLDLDALPEHDDTLVIPSEPEESGPILNVQVATLRGALLRQDFSTRKFSEMRKMSQGKHGGTRDFGIVRANCKADVRIAQATVAFSRGRLRELKSDFESDIETIGAQLDLERVKLKTGGIERAEFDTIERELFRAKADATKALSIADRALVATVAEDVPSLRGTFLERLTARHPEEGTTADSIVAWIAAALMVVSIFLPAIGSISMAAAINQSSADADSERWVALAPVVAAVILVLIGFAGDRPLRGRMLCAAWLVVTVAGAWIIHQTQFGLDPVSTRFRVGAPWILRPGMLTLVVASAAVLLAAGLALNGRDRNRTWLPLAMLAIFTDLGGVFTVTPSITITRGDVIVESEGVPLEQNTITIRNNGQRTLHLLGRNSEARAAYLLTVDKQIGNTSWDEVDLPSKPGEGFSGSGSKLIAVKPGKVADFQMRFPPGNYRVYLRSEVADDVQKPFTVEERLPPASPVATVTPPVVLAPPSTPSAPVVDIPRADVELKGVLGSPDATTRFQFVLYMPDGTQEQTMLSVEDSLHGSWIVDEYNRNLGSVTLRSGTKRLILRPGERRTLEPPTS